MQIKSVIIDDEPLALEVLRQYIEKFPSLQLLQSFDDAVAGRSYLKTNAVDLLFIDINMPDVKGTELVRSLENRPMVIFTTAYKNYALEGFELDAIDYLVKPIAFERFSKAVQKATEFYGLRQSVKPENDNLFVRAEYQLVKIPFSDIDYIESVEDYLKIHIANSRPVMTLMTMKAVLEKLPASQFARIHRSYIVQLSKIKSVVNRKVNLGNVELPVSSSYVEFIKEWTKQ
ncbi:LytR/AlgR family response regulator transcription factor [Flavisolibacter ginsenosidimutans]|uniref:Response regulator transcription factor n=1 Tax=Flavisolibacter ginsenosidimutans TaxID=661481 RepID=A0A5B8UE39_9BACT|nr:LytTR family DNA-binding domain-containing protein [Flavisolibacter ginsenosidimutans]QEC54615.1 response regulator transcription factor [Flavisolibacter ginsenosidimutans]